MKCCAAVLTLTCVILMGFGCDRKEASEAAPVVFDPDRDPHVPIPEHNPNPDLLADQVAISRRVEREKPAAAALSGEVTAGAAEAINQVRQKVADMIATAKAGQDEQLLDFFADPDTVREEVRHSACVAASRGPLKLAPPIVHAPALAGSCRAAWRRTTRRRRPRPRA